MITGNAGAAQVLADGVVIFLPQKSTKSAKMKFKKGSYLRIVEEGIRQLAIISIFLSLLRLLAAKNSLPFLLS